MQRIPQQQLPYSGIQNGSPTRFVSWKIKSTLWCLNKFIILPLFSTLLRPHTFQDRPMKMHTRTKDTDIHKPKEDTPKIQPKDQTTNPQKTKPDPEPKEQKTNKKELPTDPPHWKISGRDSKPKDPNRQPKNIPNRSPQDTPKHPNQHPWTQWQNHSTPH